VANVDGSIKGIQDYLAEQNKVQRRYQEGYDFQILKNFVRQIIQMIINLDRRIEMTEEGSIKVDLLRVRDRLVDLLDRNGVVQIIPTVGSAFDAELRQIAEAAGVVDAPSPSFSGTVADVVQPGYLYTYTDDSEKSRCLQPAKVTIFEMGLDEHDPRRQPEENEEEDVESYKEENRSSSDVDAATDEIVDDHFEDDSVESLRARMNDKLNDLFGKR
jgi:hypothetical protein